eukprot:scaffold1845_cov291-Prasinococcus_capsulatus_cf.AAC.4
MATMLQEQYEGQVPDSMEELEKLPGAPACGWCRWWEGAASPSSAGAWPTERLANAGVGHKTAGVVMIQAFDGVAFPVDTHIHRLAARWVRGRPPLSLAIG